MNNPFNTEIKPYAVLRVYGYKMGFSLTYPLIFQNIEV